MSLTELEDVPFDGPPEPESNGHHEDFRISMVRQATETETSDAMFRGIISGIVNGQWEKPVGLVRHAYQTAEKRARDAGLPDFEVVKAAKDASDPIKKRLPAVLFSGTFARRSAEAIKQHSGLICVDLDHLNERLPSIRETIEADPHCKAAFVSPSGTGLKVLFRCSPDKPHIQSYRAAERYCLEHFGLEIDPACKDVSRLCFVSYDPETFIAETCEPLPDVPDPVEFKAPPERMPGARLTAGLTPGDDYDLRGDVPALLRQHGWTAVGKHGWRRPGKSVDSSATWDKVPGRFYCFTSSTEFEANHTYKPWHVFAILNCGGDWKLAAAELRKLGYGEVLTRKLESQSSNRSANATEVYDPGYENAPKSATEPEPTAEERRALAHKELRARCYAHEFNFAVIPPKPVPRFLIKGNQVCTPGNLTTITGQAKTAKSATIDAMIASIVASDKGNTADCDCLGFTACAPKGMNVIHFDSEQVGYDHDQLIRRSLRRAKADWPSWLRSFCLTGFSITDRRLLIRLILEDMAAIGGTHSLFLDGAADCVINVNDAEECNPFVAELQNLAIEFKCPIITVIHENPGQDLGKMRGHLGSQLERKAESNLRLKKSDDVITIFSERMRHGLILEKDGPQFSWDNEALMHLSRVRGLSSKDLAKRDKLCDLIEAAFHHTGKDRLRYGELIKAIAEAGGVGASRAEARYAEMKAFGLISKDMIGLWSPTMTKG